LASRCQSPALGAQTVITLPKNSYTPAEDVELGRQASAQVEQQLPILHDEEVTSAVAPIGRRVDGKNTNGQAGFTHGVEIGVARNETHDLRTATNELVATLARSNPNLSRPSADDGAPIRGRQGLRTVLSNASSASGEQERIAVFTTLLRDSSLFYTLGVAPDDRFSDYQGTFRRIVGSIQIMD
jgi:hypothetical protein